MKWIWVIVLVLVGALAAIVAFEYLTVSIHNLPGYIPGRHPGRGHYRKRGAGAALVALVAFVGAGSLTYRNLKAPTAAGPEPSGSPVGAPLAGTPPDESDSSGA